MVDGLAPPIPRPYEPIEGLNFLRPGATCPFHGRPKHIMLNNFNYFQAFRNLLP